MENQHSFTGIIGVSQQDITPPVGIYSRNWGAAVDDVADGIHLPLMLTCITIRATASSNPLVLIGADLGWWKSHADEQSVRRPLAEALGISMDSIMCCLSHTHSGPSIWTKNADKSGGELIVSYLSTIAEAAISATEEALAAAVPATLTWKYGTCDLATNRDLYDEAQGRYLVGYNPEKTADQTLLVGRICDVNGEPIGTIVNYACHPTTLGWGNRLISPDYVGGMRRVVEADTKAPCLFLQGASGELAPAEQYSDDSSLADRYGVQLGHAALSTLYGMPPSNRQLCFEGAVTSGAPLGVWRTCDAPSNKTINAHRIDVELELITFPSIPEIERLLANSTDRVERERLTRQLGTAVLYEDQKCIKLPVWIWVLGNTMLVGQPYETYSLFQRQLREAFPTHTVAVMNFVNGPGGYLPEEPLYDQQVYSVYNSPFKKGALERLIRITIERIGAIIN